MTGAVSVTVGGDQLTRSHLDSAKKLRAGAHTVMERFGNLGPILEECFHACTTRFAGGKNSPSNHHY